MNNDVMVVQTLILRKIELNLPLMSIGTFTSQEDFSETKTLNLQNSIFLKSSVTVTSQQLHPEVEN